MKKVIKIMNLIILAFSGFAIVCFLLFPTLSIKAGVKLTKEQIVNVIPEEERGSAEIDEVIPEEGIDLDINVKIPSKVPLKALSGNDVSELITEEVVKPNVENLVKNVENLITPIGTAIIKVTVFQAYVQTYETAMNGLKQEGDSRDATALRNAGGLNDNYCMNQAENVMTALKAEGATVANLQNVFVTSVDNATNTFNAAHVTYGNLVYQIPPSSEESKAELRETVVKVFGDEALGMIKPDGVHLYSLDITLKALAVKMIRQANEEAQPEGETAEQRAALLNEEITKMLTSKLPLDQAEQITNIMKYVAFGLLGFAGIWALLFLYTLLRTLIAKKKCWTFTGPIFWILGLVQIVIGVGLTVLVAAALKNPTVISQLPAESRDLLAGITLSMKTCAFFPSIILLVMIPYQIAYFVCKHKYKKELREAPEAAPAE